MSDYFDYPMGQIVKDAIAASALGEDAISAVSKIYGVEFVGNATAGTRLFDSVGLSSGVGIKGGDRATNDFDYQHIFKGIKRRKFLARDSSGNIIYDSNSSPIYNVMIFIPNFYKKCYEYTNADGNKCTRYLISNCSQTGFTVARKNIDGTIPRGFYVPAYDLTMLGGGAQYTKASDGTLTVCGTNYLGCQKGQEPVMNYNMQSLGSRMSYIGNEGVDENLLVDIPLTRLMPCGAIEDFSALQYLFYVEFANRNTQSIMRGLCDDGVLNCKDSTNASHNYTGACNSIALPTSSYIVTNIKAGIKRITIRLSNNWEDRNVSAYTDGYDVNGASSGYTKIDFDGSAITPAGEVSVGWGAKTGWSEDMASSSGSEYSTSSGLSHMAYRGVEDLWGNLWQCLGNIAVKLTYDTSAKNYPIFKGSGQSETDPSLWNQEDGTFVSMPTSSGWIDTLSQDDKGRLIPTNVNASGAGDTTFYSDYIWADCLSASGTAYREVLVGGSGSNGGPVGLSCWYCRSGFGNGYWDFGSRPSLLL